MSAISGVVNGDRSSGGRRAFSLPDHDCTLFDDDDGVFATILGGNLGQRLGARTSAYTSDSPRMPNLPFLAEGGLKGVPITAPVTSYEYSTHGDCHWLAHPHGEEQEEWWHQDENTSLEQHRDPQPTTIHSASTMPLELLRPTAIRTPRALLTAPSIPSSSQIELTPGGTNFGIFAQPEDGCVSENSRDDHATGAALYTRSRAKLHTPVSDTDTSSFPSDVPTLSDPCHVMAADTSSRADSDLGIDVRIDVESNPPRLHGEIDSTDGMERARPMTPKKRRNKKASRNSHAEKWMARFRDLIRFKKQRGHCLVPLLDKENSQLAHWVKRQRRQFKLKMRGEKSSLTDERHRMLSEHGFVWDAHEASWESHLHQLQEFVSMHGHGKIPSRYGGNWSLGVWAKCQRRQHRLFRKGSKSNLCQQRIDTLTAIGFEWNVQENSDDSNSED